MLTRRLSRKEVAELGIYDFLGYIGAFNTPYIGGLSGTRRLLEALGIRKDSTLRVLEIACATGFTSCMIAKEFGCDVTGIDISEIVIEKAKERAERLGLQNAKFQVADAMDLPFEDDSFDIVFGVAITALVPDKEKAVSEYMRVVRPGGMIGTLDLFLKENAPADTADTFNALAQEVLGSSVHVLTIDEWKEFYSRMGLDETKLEENYESVLENPRETGMAVKATLKLLYHMIINGAVRKEMTRVLKVRKTAARQNSGQFENLGYLIFTGCNLS